MRKPAAIAPCSTTLFPGFVHPSRRDDAACANWSYDMGEDIGPEAFVRQLTAVMGRADSRPTLAMIACPTLVLTGDRTTPSRTALSVEMADGIPGAKLVTILPHCGHLPQIEQPQAIADALVGWLRI